MTSKRFLSILGFYQQKATVSLMDRLMRWKVTNNGYCARGYALGNGIDSKFGQSICDKIRTKYSSIFPKQV